MKRAMLLTALFLFIGLVLNVGLVLAFSLKHIDPIDRAIAAGGGGP